MKKIIIKDFTLLNKNEQKIVFEARNSKKVRAFCLDERVISFDEHLAFLKSLKHTNDKKYYLILLDDECLCVINFIKMGEKYNNGIYKISKKHIFIMDIIVLCTQMILNHILNQNSCIFEILRKNKALLNYHLMQKTPIYTQDDTCVTFLGSFNDDYVNTQIKSTKSLIGDFTLNIKTPNKTIEIL